MAVRIKKRRKGSGESVIIEKARFYRIPAKIIGIFAQPFLNLV
jgi:hypothetical protein